MILVLCDDPTILASAQASSTSRPDVYGAVYQFFNAATPQLGDDEDLFITAHGMQGEIGNESGPPDWNAVQLLEYLMMTSMRHHHGAQGSLFPADYRGDIYLSACYSQNIQRGGMSIAENFYSVATVELPNTTVYGQRGSVGMAIPLPGSKGWDCVGRRHRRR